MCLTGIKENMEMKLEKCEWVNEQQLVEEVVKRSIDERKTEEQVRVHVQRGVKAWEKSRVGVARHDDWQGCKTKAELLKYIVELAYGADVIEWRAIKKSEPPY